MISSASAKQIGGLLLVTALAVGIHGYHLGADDAAIYVPAIKQVADPGLYPFGAEFFLSHARLSLFPNLVGETSRITNVPADAVIFIWYGACIFLLLTAAWRLLENCFVSLPARWAGVAMIAGALSVPVAGTALAVMDPYLTARSLSTPATLFAIAAYVAGKRWQAGAWLLLTALIHPQMAMYGGVFFGCLAYAEAKKRQPERMQATYALALPVFPLLFDLEPAHGIAREVLLSRTYFFVSNWAWYEWVGVFAPLALCWWFSRRQSAGTKPPFQLLLRALVPFGLLFTTAGILLCSSSHLENMTRLQPMRAFHLLYVVFFVLLGGMLGDQVLRDKTKRWLMLLIPLAASMCFVEQITYPDSLRVEWPGAAAPNCWSSAFYWIRNHTPKNAVFAIDPDYMQAAGEDQHGFRAITERSVLADAVKDSGAVSLFPNLAEHWKQQVDAQRGLEGFQPEEFQKLARLHPVTWFVTRRAAPAGFDCPYQKDGLSVCRIPAKAPDCAARTARLSP